MSDGSLAAHRRAPPRFERPGITWYLACVLAIAFLVVSFRGAGVSPMALAEGLPSIAALVGEMVPPDLSRLGPMSRSLLQTFQMAVVGTVFGLVLSLPIAILATRKLSPHVAIYAAVRAFIGLLRTVPDLVWALIFVVSVGLGPFAGVLAIMLDTIGFCGRFFAEAMEETDDGPLAGVRSTGAGSLGVIFGAVIPAAIPSFITTSLYSLEGATRSSVVLGLVGAGGIGIELKVAMELFRYDQAATVILMVLAMVLLVERSSAAIRRRIL